MKVTVIDSSIDAAKEICRKLSAKEGFLTSYVSGTPENIFDRIVNSQPDVVVLDIELQNLTGIEVLSNLMRFNPLPVILTGFPTQKGKLSIVEGIEQGAIDFIPKPSSYFPDFIDEFIEILIRKLRMGKSADIKAFTNVLHSESIQSNREYTNGYKKKLLVFGVSNASIEAFRKFVAKLPADFPGIIVVPDMPGGFTKLFADRMNEVSNMTIKEAIEKDEIQSGRVLVAQGGFHIKIPEFIKNPYVEVFISEKVNYKRPSIDVLMLSVAEHVGSDAVGVLFSGCGEDGVLGLKAMKMSGADTIIIKPDTAILRDTLEKAEDFASHTHSVTIEEFPDLIHNLVHK